MALLLHPQLPPAVGDDVGVEQVAAQEVRVVLLHSGGEAGFRIVIEDRVGHDHAHRLAADVAGADLAHRHRQQIGQRHVLAAQLDHASLASDEHVDEFVGGFPLYRGVQRVERGPALLDDAMPVVGRIDPVRGGREESCGGLAAGDGIGFVATEQVREEHRR
ncbi:hypothetical protein SDC9_169386 [bioreactor metagenome]|uniref:Uncharacterized protein n=1 Tax=bioreactor metagenome TaxID=1076179 RepID=A0A645GDV3_9ZZZZ